MKDRREDGQSMVEFALVLPLLLLLLFGIIDFGWIFYSRLELNDTAREGARFAALSHGNYSDTDGLEAAVERELNERSQDTSVEVKVNSDGSVTVTVSRDVKVPTPLTSVFTGDTVNLSSSCTMRME